MTSRFIVTNFGERINKLNEKVRKSFTRSRITEKDDFNEPDRVRGEMITPLVPYAGQFISDLRSSKGKEGYQMPKLLSQEDQEEVLKKFSDPDALRKVSELWGDESGKRRKNIEKVRSRNVPNDNPNYVEE